MKTLVLALSLVLAVAGCSNFKLPGTGEPPDQLITSIGTIGAIGCVSFATLGKPSDVALARQAVIQLNTVLSSPNPTVSAFGVACTQAPDKFSAICAVAIDRLAAHLGGVDVLLKDSTAFKALVEFTRACSVGLS